MVLELLANKPVCYITVICIIGSFFCFRGAKEAGDGDLGV